MKFFLIAGEASGDALGAALMAGLRSLMPGAEFGGVGGPLMQAEGLASLFPMEDLSVMGLMEVLPKYRFLKRRITEAAGAAVAFAPDALITIDSPDFCLRVAKLVRATRPKQATVHYVAPTVWAWRPGRAAKMAPFIDHVLALFPFEPPFMQAAGMTCDFVGHPIVAQPRAGAADVSAFCAKHSIGRDQPLLLCLPGSRKGEVARLLPRFHEAIEQLLPNYPGLQVVLPTVRGVADLVSQLTEGWAQPPIILQDGNEKRSAFAAADFALAASGTVSLELAAYRVPMVIAHDFNRLTWWMMKRAALIDTVTLVNIVSETRAVPEFLGPACQPGPIAAALQQLLSDPEAQAAQASAAEATMARLGEGEEDPGLRAARSVLARLRAR